MTMLERANAIIFKMEQVTVARKTTHQRAAIQQRLSEWNERLRDLENLREKLAWLRSPADTQRQFPEEFPAVHALTVEAVNRLKEGSGVDALTEDALWTRLISTASSATAGLNETLQSAWGQKADSHGVVESPAGLRGRLPQTPSNGEAMARYSAQHGIYARLVNQKEPRSVNDPQTLAAAVVGLRQIFTELDFDAPPDVDAFFKAVDAGGASLPMLTRPVLDWLQANGQMDRFTVRSNIK